jgi:hypothetical protein
MPVIEDSKKPICKLIGRDGNVFNLIAIATTALKNSGYKQEAKEMSARCFDCGSYTEAIRIISEYVEVQ